MTWLILGANGQLGKSFARVLIERGIDFQALGSEELDISIELDCIKKIRLLSPNVVLNAAAWTDVDGAEADPDAAFAVNALGPLHVATAAREVGAVFIHISTDYVFSGAANSPWSEDAERGPISVYGTTKASGEIAVFSTYEERSYIFRTAWLYSPWGRNFAKTMTKLALKDEKEVQVVGDQVGQPTSASDLANQIVDSVLAELPFGIYHATNSGQASWYEFAREIFSQSGASADRVTEIKSSVFVRPAKRPTYSVLGHEAWKSVGIDGISVPKMRDWRIALGSAMPAIISAVEKE